MRCVKNCPAAWRVINVVGCHVGLSTDRIVSLPAATNDPRARRLVSRMLKRRRREIDGTSTAGRRRRRGSRHVGDNGDDVPNGFLDTRRSPPRTNNEGGLLMDIRRCWRQRKARCGDTATTLKSDIPRRDNDDRISGVGGMGGSLGVASMWGG